MKKKLTPFLACLLAGLMLFSLAVAAFPARAYAVTQQELDVLAVQRDEIRAQQAEQQALIEDLQQQQASALDLKVALEERTAFTLQQIELNKQEIALYDQMIRDKAWEVEQARAREEAQLERYRTRVRAMEENGNYDFLALLLNTTSLGAFLTAIDDIGEIMESDRQLEDAYIAARENTEQVKAEYEATKADLEVRQGELRQEVKDLESQISETELLVAELLERIANSEEEMALLREREANIQSEINEIAAELERQRRAEEERRRQEQANQGGGGGGGYTATVTGSGSFGWPCPGHTYVTSRAGDRYHPIFQEWRYHSGMDIAANTGDSIVASDGGTVSYCGVKGGYGNCIMIDHGNGYYTLYGHMSGYAVSYGDAVSKGQTIGYVGSTGWATGPHLHFEIRYEDSILDPEAVGGFTGLTYAPDAGE